MRARSSGGYDWTDPDDMDPPPSADVDAARDALWDAINQADGASDIEPAMGAFEAAIRAEGLDVERAKEAAFAIDRNGWSDEYAAKFAVEFASLAKDAER